MEKENTIVLAWQKVVSGHMFHLVKGHAVTFERVKILRIKPDILQNIKDTIGAKKPEQGGMVGGNKACITRFYWDKTAKCTDKEYIPDFNLLNSQIQKWADESVEFLGIIHSHPRGYASLSPNDVAMANEILENAPDMKYLYLFIAEVLDGDVQIYGYQINSDDS